MSSTSDPRDEATADESLDRERIEWMCVHLLSTVRANYLTGPISRDRVYENLNALAWCAARVILGSDGRGGEAEKFFQLALAKQLSEGPLIGDAQ